jgi:cellulose synthase operon protein C
MRTLNIRLLAILLVGGIFAGVAGYAVHGYQVRRNAGALLTQAAAAKEAEKFKEAIDCLQKYVALVPKASGEVLADLGLLQFETRRYPQALRNLKAALRQLPDRADVRRRLVDLSIATREYADAMDHLKVLLNSTPDNAELIELKARCQAAEGDDADAVATLDDAIEAAPGRLESYALQASLVEERLKDRARAQAILETMVSKNQDNARAFVIRGSYRLDHRLASRVSTSETEEPDAPPAAPLDASEQEQQALSLALDDARKALELEELKPRDKFDRNTIIFAVRCFLANKLPEEARKYAVQGEQLFPNDPAIYALLADVELQTEHRAEAIVWLKKGVEVSPASERQDLLWNLCNLYLEVNTLDKDDDEYVQEGLRTLRKSKYPKPLLDYLEARIKTVQEPKQWLEASVMLEKNRAQLVSWPDLAKQADYLLGKCYEAMGNTDLQLIAYRRAANVDPLWIPARTGVAGAYFAMQRYDEAFIEYAAVNNLLHAAGKSNVGVRLQLTRLMFLSNLYRRSDVDRDWDRVMGELDLIEAFSPNSTQVAILRAEVLVAQRKDSDAVILLQKARENSPEDLDPWLGLASIAERRGDSAEAQKILDDAQAKLGDSVRIRLVRARLLVNQRDPGAKEALRKLAEQPSPAFDQEQTTQLYSGLAGLSLLLEDYDETARLCKAVAKARSSDMQVRLLLFDTAIRATEWPIQERLSVMSDVLSEMQKIGGNSPQWHYGMAVELRIRADEAKSKGDDALRRKCFKDARQHLREAAAVRATWARIPLLLANIDLEEKDESAALENYLAAIQLGEEEPAIVTRALRLLNQRREFQKADDLVRRLGLDKKATGPFSNEMIQMAAEASLQLSDQRNRAIDLVTNQFKARNAAEYMWVAEKLRVLGEELKAEDNFLKAIEFDETAPDPWVALIFFYGRTNQPAKAFAAFEQAEKKIARDQVSAALARCIEFTGKSFEEMEARNLADLKASPGDVAVIRRTVEFYLRQKKPLKAEKLLEQIIKGESSATDNDRAWARRNLALALLSRGDQPSNKQAISLLDENLKSDSASDADRRAKVVVLTRMPNPRYSEEAIRLLEGLIKDPRTADPRQLAEDRYAIAEIYLKLGNKDEFNARMRALLKDHANERRFVERYVAFLESVGTDEAKEEAISWMERLERSSVVQKQDPFTAMTYSIQTLYLRERFDDILKATDEFITDSAIDANERRIRTARAAALLEYYAARHYRGAQTATAQSEESKGLVKRFLEKAEELFRRNAAENPQEALALAAFFSRHERLDDALEILESAGTSAQAGGITAVAISIMISPKATSLQLNRIDAFLRAAVEKQERNVLLVQALADLQSWRQEYEEAEALYREVLSKGDNPLVLNNLALLLALLGKGGTEPLTLIERAVELAGWEPSLLDSRATINLMLGNPQLATPDLITAIEKQASPLNYFHKAQVEWRLGQKEAARASMAKADEMGLQANNLHPLERKNYRQFIEELR